MSSMLLTFIGSTLRSDFVDEQLRSSTGYRRGAGTASVPSRRFRSVNEVDSPRARPAWIGSAQRKPTVD